MLWVICAAADCVCGCNSDLTPENMSIREKVTCITGTCCSASVAASTDWSSFSWHQPPLPWLQAGKRACKYKYLWYFMVQWGFAEQLGEELRRTAWHHLPPQEGFLPPSPAVLACTHAHTAVNKLLQPTATAQSSQAQPVQSNITGSWSQSSPERCLGTEGQPGSCWHRDHIPAHNHHVLLSCTAAQQHHRTSAQLQQGRHTSCMNCSSQVSAVPRAAGSARTADLAVCLAAEIALLPGVNYLQPCFPLTLQMMIAQRPGRGLGSSRPSAPFSSSRIAPSSAVLRATKRDDHEVGGATKLVPAKQRSMAE